MQNDGQKKEVSPHLFPIRFYIFINHERLRNTHKLFSELNSFLLIYVKPSVKLVSVVDGISECKKMFTDSLRKYFFCSDSMVKVLSLERCYFFSDTGLLGNWYPPVSSTVGSM